MPEAGLQGPDHFEIYQMLEGQTGAMEVVGLSELHKALMGRWSHQAYAEGGKAGAEYSYSRGYFRRQVRRTRVGGGVVTMANTSMRTGGDQEPGSPPARPMELRYKQDLWLACGPQSKGTVPRITIEAQAVAGRPEQNELSIYTNGIPVRGQSMVLGTKYYSRLKFVFGGHEPAAILEGRVLGIDNPIARVSTDDPRKIQKLRYAERTNSAGIDHCDTWATHAEPELRDLGKLLSLTTNVYDEVSGRYRRLTVAIIPEFFHGFVASQQDSQHPPSFHSPIIPMAVSLDNDMFQGVS